MEEITSLHNAFVAQLKETATHSYNTFYRAYEMLNEDKYQSRDKFLSLMRNNDYLLASLDFYDDKFYGLDRDEDYLYIGQILTLQVKAAHNLGVIQESDKEENTYLNRKEEYKKNLYFYYLLGKDSKKIGEILLAFLKDVEIDEEVKEEATNRYQNFLKKHQ